MIEQTSFLGMPLKTQRQRRLLVVLYYALLITLSGILLWLGKNLWGIFSSQTFLLASMLGGVRPGGPVKSYQESRPTAASGMQSLNIQGRRPFDTALPLDERERAQRDRAHYNAYRIMYFTFALAAIPYLAGLEWAPHQLNNVMPILLSSFLIYVVSLPQAVLLWTELDEPSGELVKMR